MWHNRLNMIRQRMRKDSILSGSPTMIDTSLYCVLQCGNISSHIFMLTQITLHKYTYLFDRLIQLNIVISINAQKITSQKKWLVESGTQRIPVYMCSQLVHRSLGCGTRQERPLRVPSQDSRIRETLCNAKKR